eukprot:9095062-Pyramimonas_sp.AAC.1
MPLNRLRGNRPRVEPAARTITDGYRRLWPDEVDSKEGIHLHHFLRVTLLLVQDFQTGHGSMCNLVYRNYATMTQA